MVIANSSFDAGNITQLLSASSPNRVELQINSDNNSNFLQWFYFSASAFTGEPTTFVVKNAGQTTYPDGWKDYDVFCSSDRQEWLRVPTQYENGELSWTVTAEPGELLWFAYFTPYSYQQHLDFIAEVSNTSNVSYHCLGSTIQGRSIDYLCIAAQNTPQHHSIQTDSDKTKPQVWVVARQHPGESMASWWVEGFVRRLLDPDDGAAVALRSIADFHIVPHMNPDGAVMGHLRTNALGVNLNREWLAPSVDQSPEVYHTLQKMDEVGVDLALDIHGDEAIPYNFIAGTEGVPSWDNTRQNQLVRFKHTLAMINPDFQTKYGYPRNKAGEANLSFCSNQVAERFGCLAMTLEMPFKDTANAPQPLFGWSAERSIRLGESFIDAVSLYLRGQLLTTQDESIAFPVEP